MIPGFVELRPLERLRELLKLLRGTAWSCVSDSVTIDSLRILPIVSLHKCKKCIFVSRFSQSPGPSQLSQWHLPQKSSELLNPTLAISFSEGLNWIQRDPQTESYPASLLMKEIWFEVWYCFPRFQLTNILKRSLIAYVARKYKMNLRLCWCQEHKVYIFIKSVSHIQESVLEDICIYMYRNMFIVTLFVLVRNLKAAWIFISKLQLPQI